MNAGYRILSMFYFRHYTKGHSQPGATGQGLCLIYVYPGVSCSFWRNFCRKFCLKKNTGLRKALSRIKARPYSPFLKPWRIKRHPREQFRAFLMAHKEGLKYNFRVRSDRVFGVLFQNPTSTIQYL